MIGKSLVQSSNKIAHVAKNMGHLPEFVRNDINFIFLSRWSLLFISNPWSLLEEDYYDGHLLQS